MLTLGVLYWQRMYHNILVWRRIEKKKLFSWSYSLGLYAPFSSSFEWATNNLYCLISSNPIFTDLISLNWWIPLYLLKVFLQCRLYSLLLCQNEYVLSGSHGNSCKTKCNIIPIQFVSDNWKSKSLSDRSFYGITIRISLKEIRSEFGVCTSRKWLYIVWLYR